MKGKYIYGIVKKSKVKSQKLKVEGFDGLSTVEFGNLSAVIAEVECRDYHHLPKEEAIKELIAHQQQIEKIMENFGSVLPVKFGTILRDEEEVRSVLEKAYSFLRNTLRKVEAKIELDLVCFWNEQKAAQMAFQESKKIRDFYKKIAKTPRMVVRQRAQLLRGEGIEEKIALGKLVGQYLENKKKKLSSQILKVLKKETVESCCHVLADVNMLLNQALLVEKKNEKRFNQAIKKLDDQFNGLINFRLVGPLPPYSFATVVVESLDKKEVEKAKELLNLNGSASLTTGGEINKENLKKAYRKLAFGLHPDKGGDPMAFEFVTKGYKLLRKYVEHGLVNIYLYQWKEQGRL